MKPRLLAALAAVSVLGSAGCNRSPCAAPDPPPAVRVCANSDGTYVINGLRADTAEDVGSTFAAAVAATRPTGTSQPTERIVDVRFEDPDTALYSRLAPILLAGFGLDYCRFRIDGTPLTMPTLAELREVERFDPEPTRLGPAPRVESPADLKKVREYFDKAPATDRPRFVVLDPGPRTPLKLYLQTFDACRQSGAVLAVGIIRPAVGAGVAILARPEDRIGGGGGGEATDFARMTADPSKSKVRLFGVDAHAANVVYV
ncbi:MAG TPA: hypothetical protein VFJ30_17020, partial [Phycisphaerae bacterium]|nr:hypothetical protein [Phycisphaerae bacterium]